jgi:hypothetical protein
VKTPPCFDSEHQFTQWINLDSISYGRREMKATGYCRDCTPEYAQRMRDAGRCNQPQVNFNTTPDGEMVGTGFSFELAEEEYEPYAALAQTS